MKRESNRLRHGHNRKGQRSPTYTAWVNMRSRCERTTTYAFYRYGARGISVCDRWQLFDNFLSDMGEKPAGLTLERRDRNENYSPSNCYWASWTTQHRNQSNTVLSPDKVKSIRRLAAHFSTRQLSDRFLVTMAAIRHVVRRVTWSDV